MTGAVVAQAMGGAPIRPADPTAIRQSTIPVGVRLRTWHPGTEVQLVWGLQADVSSICEPAARPADRSMGPTPCVSTVWFRGAPMVGTRLVLSEQTHGLLALDAHVGLTVNQEAHRAWSPILGGVVHLGPSAQVGDGARPLVVGVEVRAGMPYRVRQPLCAPRCLAIREDPGGTGLAIVVGWGPEVAP